MKRLLLAAVLSLLSIAALGYALPQRGPAQAAFPAADLSTDLLFDCLDDGSIRAAFGWQSSGQGPQWLDVSVNDDGFTSSFQAAGPLASGQNGLLWDGLAPSTLYFVRINTLTADGWFPSDTMYFFTPNDCPSFAVAQTPGLAPADCPPASGGLFGCVWTQRPDFSVYGIGEAVNFCYVVSGTTDLMIVVEKPDQTSLLVIDGFVNGTSACIGPFRADVPLGQRTVRMYGAGSLLDETHFEVR
jgi:hypothetical protein